MNYWYDSNGTVNSTILIYFEKNIKRTNRHIFKVEFRQNDTYLLLETQTKKILQDKRFIDKYIFWSSMFFVTKIPYNLYLLHSFTFLVFLSVNYYAVLP